VSERDSVLSLSSRQTAVCVCCDIIILRVLFASHNLRTAESFGNHCCSSASIGTFRTACASDILLSSEINFHWIHFCYFYFISVCCFFTVASPPEHSSKNKESRPSTPHWARCGRVYWGINWEIEDYSWVARLLAPGAHSLDTAWPESPDFALNLIPNTYRLAIRRDSVTDYFE